MVISGWAEDGGLEIWEEETHLFKHFYIMTFKGKEIQRRFKGKDYSLSQEVHNITKEKIIM